MRIAHKLKKKQIILRLSRKKLFFVIK